MKRTILSLIIAGAFMPSANAQSLYVDSSLLAPSAKSRRGEQATPIAVSEKQGRLPYVPDLTKPSTRVASRGSSLAASDTATIGRSYEPRIPNLPNEMHTWTKVGSVSSEVAIIPARVRPAELESRTAEMAVNRVVGSDSAKLEPVKASERAPAILAAWIDADAMKGGAPILGSPEPETVVVSASTDLPVIAAFVPTLTAEVSLPIKTSEALPFLTPALSAEPVIPEAVQPRLSTPAKPTTRAATAAPRPSPVTELRVDRAPGQRVERVAESRTDPRTDLVQTAGVLTAGVPTPEAIRLRPPGLDSTSKEALRQSQEFMARDNLPTQGDDGRVVYTYGAGMPTVICAPLRVCSVELQPGERITGALHAGDTIRWHISPAETGAGKAASTLIVIKPKDIGLETNLLIPTDRRVYFLRLVSRATDFTARVSFAYPDDVKAAWESYQQRQAELVKTVTAELPATSMDKLFFGYDLQGEQRFKPVRVFDDGQKTYIQLPESVRNREQPSLIVLGVDGKEQLVNYRVRNDYFIVDRIFDRAALILGVGSSQEKVTIARREPGRDWSWLGFGNRSAGRTNSNPNVLSGVDNAQ